MKQATWCMKQPPARVKQPRGESQGQQSRGEAVPYIRQPVVKQELPEWRPQPELGDEAAPQQQEGQPSNDEP